MKKTFDSLLAEVSARRPSENRPTGRVFFYKEHPVQLIAGEMEGIHWVDIQIELKRFQLTNLNAALKVLKANLEMGAATPIPTWFAANAQGTLIFINRLDWQHLSVDVLDDHIMRCIEQMGQALASEGV
ncbi:MAG: hypothetical protein QE278_11345 [Limnobacter sp.]|nr:hypothetical protein [Limnobacter sp.]